MMRLLAIDSSGPVASAAYFADGRLLSECSVDYGKKHSTTLLPMIERVLAQVEAAPQDIDAIAITAGPGSFTGLRIGSATAKGLALALDVPIVPVPTLDAIAYNVCGYPGIACPIMDARRDQVYNALYRFENDRLVPLTEQRAVYMSDVIEELCERSGEQEAPVMFLGDGVPVFREMIEERMRVPYQFASPHLIRQRAASVGALGLRLYAEGVKETAAGHAPFYLRKSQAEQEKERRTV